MERLLPGSMLPLVLCRLLAFYSIKIDKIILFVFLFFLSNLKRESSTTFPYSTTTIMGKNQKAKKQVLSLNSFLADDSLGTDWADDVEDLPTAPSREFAPAGGDSMGLGSAPDRGARQTFPIPDNPPFTAFLGNLSFETSEADLETLFRGLKGVLNMCKI